MIDILLNGCNGHMGRVVTGLCDDDHDVNIAAGVDLVPDKIKNDYPVYGSLSEVKEEFDAVVDFSNAGGLHGLLKFCAGKGSPVVICTTGLDDDDRARIAESSKEIPILVSANMSVGINVILNIVKYAAKALGNSFDIEIVEKHHSRKADSPSGTALAIADSINSVLDSPRRYVYGRHSSTEGRSKNEIGIHSIRGGNIVGDHSVIFAGSGEVIEISHSAISRDVFGVGALRAAKYICGKQPGLYSMGDAIDIG